MKVAKHNPYGTIGIIMNSIKIKIKYSNVLSGFLRETTLHLLKKDFLKRRVGKLYFIGRLKQALVV